MSSDPRDPPVADRYGPQNPTYHRRCAYCADLTPHAGFTDEHGCEVGPACLYCGTFSSRRACRYTREMPPQRVARPQQDMAALRRRRSA